MSNNTIPAFSKDIIDGKTHSNIGLKFYKHVKFNINPRNQNESYSLSINQDIISNNSIHQHLLEAIHEKQAYLVNTIFTAKNISADYSLKNKLITGLGNQHILENGFAFHAVYGIPYLPGSGIKGILRNMIIVQYFDADFELANKNTFFNFLFGKEDDNKTDYNTSESGSCIFLDAYPIEKITIVKDIINQHNKNYYNKGIELINFEKPIPIFFIAIKNTSFRFRIALKENKILSEFKDIEMLKIEHQIREIDKIINKLIDNKNALVSELLSLFLEKVLLYEGFGAKTSLDYGKFIK